MARRIHGNTLNIITPRNHVFLDYDYHHLGQIGTNEANLKIFCDLKKAVKTYLTCNIYFQNLFILGYVCFEQKKIFSIIRISIASDVQIRILSKTEKFEMIYLLNFSLLNNISYSIQSNCPSNAELCVSFIFTRAVSLTMDNARQAMITGAKICV